MADAGDSKRVTDTPQDKERRSEALPERLLRRVLESMGDVVDRKFGRTIEPKSGLTTSKLVERMKRLIDERVRDEGKGKIAPHHLVLKVEWGTHSEAPPEIINDLKNEILAAAVDHINDHRYRTLAPVTVDAEVDIFTSGISVDPNFGEFEEQLRQEDLERRTKAAGVVTPAYASPPMPDIQVMARISFRDGTREIPLAFKPGGRRLNVGRASDNELTLNDASVSKIHGALLMTSEGTILVADTGSTNGTYINGRRIAYGESRQVEDGDVIGFGDIEVRLRRSD
jgi:hypothetical protein